MEKINIKGPLIGCDIYHGNMPFSRTFGDFQIHKATEGVSFNDNDFEAWTRDCSCSHLGAYHFAGKNFKTVYKQEAQHFVSRLRECDFKGIVILDLESQAMEDCVKDPVLGLQFLEYVKGELKTDVFLYTNTDGTNRLSIRYAEYPLWIASYNKHSPSINNTFRERQVKTFAKEYFIWQFTSKPFDIDIANMTQAEWNAYSTIKQY